MENNMLDVSSCWDKSINGHRLQRKSKRRASMMSVNFSVTKVKKIKTKRIRFKPINDDEDENFFQRELRIKVSNYINVKGIKYISKE